MKLIYALLLAFCFFSTSGQVTYQKNYRNTSYLLLLTATETLDGGYVFAGQIGSYASTINTYVVKTDSLGNQQWAKIYESLPQSASWAYDVTPTKDGGYVLTGAASDSISTNVYLLKVDDTGKVQWSTKYGSSVGTSWGRYVRQTKDGGFIVLGDAIGGTNGIANNGVYLVKTDSLGNLQWTKTYNTLGEWGYFVIEHESNGLYTVGGYSLYANPSVTRGFLMRIDSVGNPIWARGYGQLPFSFYAYAPSTDGGYFFGGSAYTTPLNYGPYVLKTDSLFNPIWINEYAHNISSDGLYRIQRTADGGCLLLGKTDVGTSSMPQINIMLTKIDSSGIAQWSKAIGQPGYEYPRYAKQLNDTGYVILGSSTDASNQTDFCFIKTDSTGNTCFSSVITPIITSIPLILDTFSFNVGSIDSAWSVTFTASNSGYDTLLCYNVNTSVTAPLNLPDDLLVFPNPASRYVSFQAKQNISSIEVFNSIGIKVYTEKPKSNTISIDVTKYPEGVYFYKVEVGDASKVGKLLVQ